MKREERRLRIERRLKIYSLASKNTENYFSNPTRINLGCKYPKIFLPFKEFLKPGEKKFPSGGRSII